MHLTDLINTTKYEAEGPILTNSLYHVINSYLIKHVR